MTDEKRWRTEVPNIIDDLGLDPHERALYVHYKRSCGGNDCEWTESARVTGQKTKMSHTRAASARASLVKRGLIQLIPKGNDGTAVRIVNIWELNTLFYQDDNRPDIDGWTVEQLKEKYQGVNIIYTLEPSVNNVYTSVNNVYNKKEPIKKEPLKKDSPFRDGEPSPTPKEVKVKEPTVKQLESQAMFKALADLCQYDLDLMGDKERGKLNQAEKKMRDKGYTPDNLKAFSDWWYEFDWRGKQDQSPTLNHIRETWGQFRNHQNGTNGRDSPPKTMIVITPVSQKSAEEI